MAVTERDSTTDVIDELGAWLESNWDPDLTVAELVGPAGTRRLGGAIAPENAYGKGLSRNDAVRVQAEIGRFGALGAPAGLGLMLAAPTIATHASQEQIDLYIKDIVTGQKAWCQLFSEPGAGSDLAGLTTRAERDGDEFIVNGQKVWTSGGQYADLGMLLARTNFDAPKHQGITWFAIDMHQPGVEVRPLRELTGRAMFNEVFLSDARVSADAIIGDLNAGWAAANTTLAHERAGLGARVAVVAATARHCPAPSPVSSTGGRVTSRRRAMRARPPRTAVAADEAGARSCSSIWRRATARSPTRRCARASCSCTRSVRSVASTVCA